MNNEPFHVMSQEWRYFSRQKSLIHTLHLGQLPTGTVGETILIDATAPQSTTDGASWKVPPLILPVIPSGPNGGNMELVRTIKSPCFGSVSWNKQILAQRNMSISMSPWDDNQLTITMIPHEQGRFLCGISGQSDIHGVPYNYQGPVVGGKQNSLIRLQILRDIRTICITQPSLNMAGLFDATHWRSTFYITSILSGAATGYAMVGKDQPVIGLGQFLGASSEAHLSMWMFKISE